MTRQNRDDKQDHPPVIRGHVRKLFDLLAGMHIQLCTAYFFLTTSIATWRHCTYIVYIYKYTHTHTIDICICYWTRRIFHCHPILPWQLGTRRFLDGAWPLRAVLSARRAFSSPRCQRSCGQFWWEQHLPNPLGGGLMLISGCAWAKTEIHRQNLQIDPRKGE